MMRHSALKATLLASILAAGGACVPTPLGASGSEPSLAGVSPTRDSTFTSTRQVNGLLAAPDGSLWAATSGGVLRLSPGGSRQKWTRHDGLPSHEARRVTLGEGGSPRVHFPKHEATFDAGKWKLQPRSAPPDASSTCTWKDASWAATPRGLTRTQKGSALQKAQKIALPPSSGTHVSALLPRGEFLWAALFGDGLWKFDGSKWARAEPALPVEAREVTALAQGVGAGAPLWVGTRRGGIWKLEGQRWRSLPQGDEPFDTNVQFLASFGGALWASTLEDGLVARTQDGWKRYGEPEMSSNAPRQMAAFEGSLYVRHGGGQVDKFDGKAWAKNVFPGLPRGKVLALCASQDSLFLGQWGGWSEWKGGALTHHLRLPELQGIPPMALHARGKSLWIGTQSRGLFEATPQNQSYALRVWDERHGLPDDWVVSLASTQRGLAAGTFVGGLATHEDGDGARPPWREAPELAGQNVTALAPSEGPNESLNDGHASDALWAATRHGLWVRDAQGNARPLTHKLPALDTEIQALLATPQGLWVGARTSLSFLPKTTLQVLAAPSAAPPQEEAKETLVQTPPKSP